MKLTIAITLSALLAGCYAEEDSLELHRSYPDGVEVVVIDPGDVDSPPAMQRPNFPGGDVALFENEIAETENEFRPLPDRPPFNGSGDKIDPGASDSRPQFPGGLDRSDLPNEAPVYDTRDDDGSRYHPGRTDVYDVGNDDGDGGRLLPEDPAEIASTEDSAPTKDPCTCDDTECMEDWIAENLGCNVCATFVCGDDYTPGACYICD